MNVALVKNAEHDVNGRERCQDEERLASQRCLKCLGGTGKTSMNAARHLDALLHMLSRRNGITQRHASGEIERNCDRRKLTLVIDSNRRSRRLVTGNCA